ncbi:hypothetical protein HU200_018564 [Digitaria exilis]|uniref:Uncharacterized protein n=1 Tax=Digitaria exilis TaxID=1010633 RepID=A0A835KFR9_9POAL|nr:hypothetical protein HU200_018564 [Digitaria exilis]
MSFTTVGSTGTAAAPTTAPPASSHVRQVLQEHRPREISSAPTRRNASATHCRITLTDGGHVHVTRPVDTGDPTSPLLTVNASATHCRITLTDDMTQHGAPDYYSHSDAAISATRRWMNTQHSLRRVTITASPGTLHLARVDGGGGGRGVPWGGTSAGGIGCAEDLLTQCSPCAGVVEEEDAAHLQDGEPYAGEDVAVLGEQNLIGPISRAGSQGGNGVGGTCSRRWCARSAGDGEADLQQRKEETLMLRLRPGLFESRQGSLRTTRVV